MSPKKPRPEMRDESPLAFDITQEIDPAIVEELHRKAEQTLTQSDFDDVTVVLPQKPKR